MVFGGEKSTGQDAGRDVQANIFEACEPSRSTGVRDSQEHRKPSCWLSLKHSFMRAFGHQSTNISCLPAPAGRQALSQVLGTQH